MACGQLANYSEPCDVACLTNKC